MSYLFASALDPTQIGFLNARVRWTADQSCFMPSDRGCDVAACRHQPYLQHVLSRKRFALSISPLRRYERPMSQLATQLLALPRPLIALAVVTAALIAAAVGLWAHYGTAVFYEMIAAGVAWCL